MTGSTVIGTKTMMAGSPGYQAPEQLRAQSIGPHCDCYAFGCVIIVIFDRPKSVNVAFNVRGSTYVKSIV